MEHTYLESHQNDFKCKSSTMWDEQSLSPLYNGDITIANDAIKTSI